MPVDLYHATLWLNEGAWAQGGRGPFRGQAGTSQINNHLGSSGQESQPGCLLLTLFLKKSAISKQQVFSWASSGQRHVLATTSNSSAGGEPPGPVGRYLTACEHGKAEKSMNLPYGPFTAEARRACTSVPFLKGEDCSDRWPHGPGH